MKIKELIKEAGVITVFGSDQAEVTGISYDSRKVQQGHLFVAMQGEKVDGRSFIKSALDRGASAVIFDGDLEDVKGMTKNACLIKVEESRRALASVSSTFFGNPSKKLSIIGITGTNGKTTTSYILKSILEAWGKKVGLIGTIQYLIDGDVFQATHTTPESLEFQRLLSDMHAAGCSHVVTEVSSHALSQHRTDSTRFISGIFTNLTRDHLDFHGTMEEYFSSKKRFFSDLLDKDSAAIINHDDEWGRKLLGQIKCQAFTYGLEADADLTASDINSSFGGLTFSLRFAGADYHVSSTLIGLPNVYNILAASGAAISAGVPMDSVLEGIKNSPSIRGRFEKIDAGQKFLAVVDFAHTQDALERLIYTARGLTKGRIITVFGCGGDRDRGKRPRMGAVATRLSDFVIITSDNPRSEKPEDILKEIECGATRKNYLLEPDRTEAIRRAVLMTEDGDVLLIAGKGHETYQEICGERIPFNDREVLETSIRHLIDRR